MLENIGELEEDSAGAIEAISNLNTSSIKDYRKAIDQARRVVNNILSSFIDSYPLDTNKTLFDLLTQIDQISQPKKQGLDIQESDDDSSVTSDNVSEPQETIEACIANVDAVIEEFIENMDADDYKQLVSAYVLAKLAYEAEERMQQIFTEEELIPDPETRYLLHETPEQRIARLTAEIQALVAEKNSIDDLQLAAVKSIDLAILIQKQSSDPRVKQITANLIAFSTKKFGRNKNKNEQFQALIQDIDQLPETENKQALRVCLNSQIIINTISDFKAQHYNLTKFRSDSDSSEYSLDEKHIHELIKSIVHSVPVLQDMLQDSTDCIAHEKEIIVSLIETNTSRLETELRKYRIKATVFEIDPELVQLALDVIAGAKGCVELARNRWKLNEPTAEVRKEQSSGNGEPRKRRHTIRRAPTKRRF
jgi:hypothetical protein